MLDRKNDIDQYPAEVPVPNLEKALDELIQESESAQRIALFLLALCMVIVITIIAFPKKDEPTTSKEPSREKRTETA